MLKDTDFRHFPGKSVIKCGAVTIAQLHSAKLELRFSAGSNTARSVSAIRDGEDL